MITILENNVNPKLTYCAEMSCKLKIGTLKNANVYTKFLHAYLFYDYEINNNNNNNNNVGGVV